MNYPQQQNPNSFVVGDFTTVTTNTLSNQFSDDWLANNDLFKQQDVFQDILNNLLPISPPLTASPVTPEDNSMAEAAFVALFPDILNTPQIPPPRPVVQQQQQQQQQQQRRVIAPKPIMPKPVGVPIAPKPEHFVPPAMKRKSVVMESDETAQKRQKNTDAARRSRLKKIIKMENLEKKVTELESDNSRLTTRVAVLESEKNSLLSKDKSLEERIRVLEAQLAEAHRALTSINKD